MSHVNYTTPVGHWVAEYPQTADVFEMLRIDYCCDGDKTLEQACWENGLEPLRVHCLLQRIIAEIDVKIDDWQHASLSSLCDHIEQTHHAYLKNTFPILTSVIAEVVGRHAETYPELLDVQAYFKNWRDDVLQIMAREEKIVFPAIKQLEVPESMQSEPMHEVSVDRLVKIIREVSFDHEDVGKSLRTSRLVAADYRVPPDAGSIHRQMLGLLRRLETDMRHHVHKENYILFPRTIELITKIAAT